MDLILIELSWDIGKTYIFSKHTYILYANFTFGPTPPPAATTSEVLTNKLAHTLHL